MGKDDKGAWMMIEIHKWANEQVMIAMVSKTYDMVCSRKTSYVFLLLGVSGQWTLVDQLRFYSGEISHIIKDWVP